MIIIVNVMTIIRETLQVSLGMVLRRNYHLPASFTSKTSSTRKLLKFDSGLHRHYGKEIIARRLQLTNDDEKVEILWLKLYKVKSPLLRCLRC